MSAPSGGVDVETAPSGPDVRLLIPALTSWALVAALFGVGRFGLLVGAVLAAGVSAITWRHRYRGSLARVTLLTSVAVAAVLGCAAGHDTIARAGPVPSLADAGAVVTLEGVVSTEPRLVQRPAGDDLVVLRLRVDAVSGRGHHATVRTPVLVFADPVWAGVPWRSQVSLSGQLSPAEAGADVVAVVHAHGPADEVVEPGGGWAVADTARARLREAVDPLPADARGLLPGLVIGDTSLTPPDLTEAMLHTGMTHLSAVSGSNVAIVIGFVMVCCGWVGVTRRWRPVIAVVAIVCFVVLCRPEPSVLRAATMGTIGLIALGTHSRRAALPALAAAILGLLCIDPALSRSYGFALSCLATLGLVLFARPWGVALGRLLPARLSLLGYAVAVPAAAQVMCGPVIVLLQGAVQPIAVAANLAAAPLVPPATIAGIAAAIGALIWPPLGVLGAWAGAAPGWLIGVIARVCAVIPGGSIEWLPGAAGAVLLAALTVLAIVAGPSMLHRLRRRPLLVTGAGLLVLVLVAPLPVGSGRPGEWVVVGCDVGQGDAFLVRSGPGRAVLIDTGPEPESVAACLGAWGIRHLDAVVLTHLHADHVGGIAGVLESASVTVAYFPAYGQDENAVTTLSDHLHHAGVPHRSLTAGERLQWGDVAAEVLWPARAINAGSVANNASLVLAVTGGGVRGLFTGDIETEAGAAVLARLPEGGFDVLKVAHHGSAAQDVRLLQASGARVAMIGVGADNTFGHPAPSVLAELDRVGMVTLRTDLHGDIAVIGTPDGPAVWVQHSAADSGLG